MTIDAAWTRFVRGWRNLRGLWLPRCSRSEPCCDLECLDHRRALCQDRRGYVVKVSALYVERGGPYFTMPDVDPWDVMRDARLYDGPHPVVTHAPCGPWGELRHLYRGNEHDCAWFALAAVRRWGGVFEHPHRSKFWPIARLPKPGEFPDEHGGFSVLVDQMAYGHVARKRTILYVCGIDRAAIGRSVRTGGTATHWCSGSRRGRVRTGSGGVAPDWIKFCSSGQRRRTPPAFARWLVDHAATATATEDR